MLQRLLRERRRRNAKKRHVTWKKRQSSMDRKRKLEAELGLIKETVKPDVVVSMEHGISIGVHVCRTPNGAAAYRFELFRKDPQRGYVTTFSAGDLDALERAIAKTRYWIQNRK